MFSNKQIIVRTLLTWRGTAEPTAHTDLNHGKHTHHTILGYPGVGHNTSTQYKDKRKELAKIQNLTCHSIYRDDIFNRISFCNLLFDL